MPRDYYSDDDTEQYELVEDQEEIDNLEIPDVSWKEDIENIPDHDLQLEEIELAKKLLNDEKTLRERLDKGEISIGKYDVIHQDIIWPKMRKAATRCGLKSVDLTWDRLGSLSEEAGDLATGDLKMSKLMDRLKDTIDSIGPDAAEELADRMHDEERLSDGTHERIKRQVRLTRSNSRK